MHSRPHVSGALAAMRFHVLMLALVLAVCLVTQLLVLGFVHFTQARWEEVSKVEAKQQTLAVVVPGKEAAPAPVEPAKVQGKAAFDATRKSEKTAAPTLVLGHWDGVLRQFSGLACSAGVISAMVLAIVCMLGVVVAGGGAVPGIERTVSAAVWSLVLGLVCVPWKDALPSVPFPGVFGSYDRVTRMSEAVSAGAGSGFVFFLTYFVLPAVALAATVLVGVRFRSGVEAGVITTAVSEVDELLEREMAGIRTRGVGSNVGARTGGVLTRALGDTVSGGGVGEGAASLNVPIPPPAGLGNPAVGVAAPKSDPPRRARGWVSPHDRLAGGTAGDPEPAKRPI